VSDGGPAAAPTGRLLAAAGAGVGAVLLVVPVVVWLDLERSTVVTLVTNVARVVAATMFLTAGAIRLARWWVTDEARSAYMGASLVVLGGVMLPLWHLARTLGGGDPSNLVPVLTRGVGTAVCLALAVTALARGDDDSLLLRPRMLLARGAGLTAGAFSGLLAVGVLLPGVLQADRAVHITLDAAMVCGWVAVALCAVRRDASQRWAGRAAPLLAAMGVVELFRLLSTAFGGPWLTAAALLSALLGVVTCWAALRDLFDATSAAHERADDLSTALGQANAAATAHDAWREELTHDLRNALVGLRAALHTLSTYDGALDETTARQLRDAAVDEVAHLEHLVDGADREEVVDFEVAAVVRTVVRTRRATGQRVRLAGTAGVVRGRPGDLATVLQNLLVNAAAHAPGSPVTVQLGTGDGFVEVAVSDRGPGLTEDDAARVFDRGVRGATSNGSGLGLYVARTLMRKHGGDVELRSRVGGACFVVVLPVVERRACERSPLSGRVTA
jgi:two-component system OmpR family sensor kinase